MDIFGQHFSLLEIAASLVTLLAIWLTVKESRWCFPTGILSCLLYAIVFYDPGIRFYADAFLQLVFLVLLVYGWIHWSTDKEKQNSLPVTQFSSRQRWMLSAAILACTAGIGYLLKNFTPDPLPYPDALTTSMSLAAQWMVARKKIENWTVWIVANTLYVYMYVYKELYITAGLYFLLLILAIAGWKEWRKHLVTIPTNEAGAHT